MTDSSQMLGVKTGELGQFGSDLQLSAAIVTNSAKRVSDNMFGAGDAGRNYASHGKAIHGGLENVVKWLKAWGSAGAAIGDTAGAASIVYSDTDKENADKTKNA